MVHQVKLANDEVHEFPDEATPEQIMAALTSSSPPQTFGGEVSHTGNALKDWFFSLPGKARDELVSGINAAPREIVGAVSHPGRTLKNVGAGIADIGGDTMNLFSQMGNVDPTSGRMPSEPQNPNFNFTPGITKAYGLDNEQEGDTMVRGLVHNLPAIVPGVGVAKNALSAGAHGAISAFDFINGAPRAAAAQEELSTAEKAAATANEAHQLANQQTQLVKQETGASSPPAVQRQLDAKEAALNEANQHMAAFSHQMENLPPVNLGEAVQARQEAEHRLTAANEIQSSAQLAADNSTKAIHDYLAPNAPHDVNVAREIDKDYTANKRGISSGYDTLEQAFAQKNVQVDNAAAIQAKTDELNHLIKTNLARSPDASAAIRELDRLKTEKSTSAKDYLTAYRSVSQLARESRERAYSSGLNAKDRAEEFQRLDELDKKVDEMGKTLEESVGSADYGMLKNLNQRWRTEVIPVERNPIYRRLHKSQQMPANIIHSLRGDEPGNVILRNYIQNNPMALKNTIGQRYATNPDRVLQPNDLTKSYIEKAPELMRMQGYQDAIQDSLKRANQNVDMAHKQHQLAIEAENKEVSSKGVRDKEQETLQKQMGKTHEQILSLQKELPNLIENRDRLQVAFDRQGQTLKQKAASAKALEEAKTKVDNTQTNIQKLTKVTKLLGGKVIGAFVAGKIL